MTTGTLILEHLKRNPDALLTTADLAEALHLTGDSARNALRRLHLKGLVLCTSEARSRSWKLTPPAIVTEAEPGSTSVVVPLPQHTDAIRDAFPEA